MSKSRRRVRKGSMAVMLCITLVSLTGCQDVAITEQVNQEITVEVTNPVRDTILIENSFIGTIEPSSEVVVTPKIAGEVLEANFEVGDTVQEGDLLFTIDDSAIQISLAAATATYESAQAGLLSAQASLKAQEASHVSVEATAQRQSGKWIPMKWN